MARAVARDHDLLDLEQHVQSPAPGGDDRDPRHRRDLHNHHRRHRPFGRRDRRIHLDDGGLVARQPFRLRLVRRGRRRDLARDRRLDRPLPRLRRHADGSAPVHHDAGDDVRAARHRLSHHQRRDDFGRQRRLHRLLARELPGLSWTDGTWFAMPALFWMVLVVATPLYILLTKYPWGRYLLVIGSNKEAAILSGVNVTAMIYLAYTISAFCAAIVGV